MQPSVTKKAQLKWQCRRGMLELDLVLERFLSTGFNQLSPQQLLKFEELLKYPDPDLYAWLMGYSESPMELIEIVSFIRAHNQTKPAL